MNTPYGPARITPTSPQPPPLTPNPHSPRNSEQDRFESQYEAPPMPLTLAGVIDTVLRRPAQLVHALVEPHSRQARHVTVLGIALGLLLHGLVIASFSGGHQCWAVPLKVTVGTLFAMAICFPSFYIFNAISGGKQNANQLLGVQLAAMLLVVLILTGFAPVAWLFAQSTESARFMGFLHLLFWLVALAFGMGLLRRSLVHLNGKETQGVYCWAVVFLLVTLQLTCALRPLLGPYAGLALASKRFFLGLWLSFNW